jgi:F-type H+-transporting ATPase subunit a
VMRGIGNAIADTFLLFLAQTHEPGVFEKPTTKLFVFDCVTGALHIGPLEFCINRVIALLVLASFLFLLLFFLAFRKPKVVPGKFQALMEMGIEFIRQQVVTQMIGPDGMRFLPFLATLFFFIFIGNILEVIPGINFPVNSRVAFPLVMALVAWVVYNYVGIRSQGLGGYLKNVCFPPGAPKIMYILLTPIEFLSVIVVRPFTLTVRLTANMVAGHFLLTVFFVGTATLLEKAVTATFALFSFGFAIVLVGFEIFVALLQAFIFSVLTASYIAGATHPEH